MRLAAVLLASACYQPTVATGVPCSSTRDCPAGQVCAANDRCELPGRDAALDAFEPPIDGPLGAFSAPRKLGELNSDGTDTDPSISADGLEIVFSSDRPGGAGGTDLYRATRKLVTDPFDPPQRILELSTPDLDNASELAGDGLTIYLRRVGPTGTPDIYRAQRPAPTAPFEPPVYEPSLSSAVEETNPGISRDGRTFSTTRASANAARELYIHEREPSGSWGTARHLAELSSMADDSGAAFGTTGLVLVFHSHRASTIDAGDLYLASRPNRNQPFASVPLTELNTDASESDPSITADLRYIVFECALDLCYATR